MDEYSETRVGPVQCPDVLSGFLGTRLVDGTVIVGQDVDEVCVGLVLRFEDGDLVIGTFGDEWVLAVSRCRRPPLVTYLCSPSCTAVAGSGDVFVS